MILGKKKKNKRILFSIYFYYTSLFLKEFIYNNNTPRYTCTIFFFYPEKKKKFPHMRLVVLPRIFRRQIATIRLSIKLYLKPSKLFKPTHAIIMQLFLFTFAINSSTIICLSEGHSNSYTETHKCKSVE